MIPKFIEVGTFDFWPDKCRFENLSNNELIIYCNENDIEPSDNKLTLLSCIKLYKLNEYLVKCSKTWWQGLANSDILMWNKFIKKILNLNYYYFEKIVFMEIIENDLVYHLLNYPNVFKVTVKDYQNKEILLDLLLKLMKDYETCKATLLVMDIPYSSENDSC
jgi:hypothetical protein